jgi:hypothetical protein
MLQPATDLTLFVASISFSISSLGCVAKLFDDAVAEGLMVWPSGIAASISSCNINASSLQSDHNLAIISIT